MFGNDNILAFLDVLRSLIEKQKDQLKEQISSLESYDKIQEQMHVRFSYARDGEKRVPRISRLPTINSIQLVLVNRSPIMIPLFSFALKNFQRILFLRKR